jgi:hypothetical protein
MIKITVEDHKCELEVRGTTSDAVAELIIGIEQSIEAFSRITGANKDTALADVFTILRAHQKEKANDKT